MALIKSVRGFTPKIGNNCYLAENSTIIGDVIIGNNCSFWFNSIVRGDVNSIRIGNNVNVQDGAIIHCTFNKTTTQIGDNVSIGHNVIVHGATIHNNVLIGMGAIIMDNSEIGENTIIAAGALILENTIVEAGSIYGGIPAKKIKSIEPGQTKEMIERIANNYIMYAKWYQ
ncbi:MAG TPA: gamma carbonic anhydrase family protein [Bacteroidales bacterium]|jgi:carbonic anhydrase/acetyltransferase-like protein (isoleucine patch superfamily)|nr:gamma carbonic anhydrase family protein [Bacteroidales bacterium]